MHDHTPPTASPETWASAHRITQRVWRPLERFLHVEAASGVALLIAAAVALFWANSPWSASYEHLWHTPFTVGVGRFLFTKPLHFLVNDGLMVIFFFVVGLEIRREIHEGELSEPKRAVLPVAAALGGMIAPALLFFALNRAPAVQRGWGVPTATDIAFAVGVLALLGKRVPPALRVLLLALAIIDDIGAILVIAVFYSSGVVWAGLAVAAGAALGVLLMQRLGVRSALVYVIPGVVLWGGMLHAGVHPTIAGVILGLLTPARSWFGESGFVATTREVLRDLRARTGQTGHDTSDLAGSLRQMRVAQREAQSPVVRLQAALHPWVAYGIMPLFALANAGVSLRGLGLADPDTKTIALGIIIGLVLGKPLGILTVSFLSVRLGICALPHGVGWRGVFLVGCVAGIGFTMAIFIAGLAFPDPRLLGAAKLGVLIASALAAVIGLLVGRAVLPRAPAHGAAATLEEAEASAEM